MFFLKGFMLRNFESCESRGRSLEALLQTTVQYIIGQKGDGWLLSNKEEEAYLW